MMYTSEGRFQVFIVDDEPMALMIAGSVFESAEFAVRVFADAPSLLAALADVEAPAPDLILLDIEMPGMNGIAACHALRAAGHEAPLVMFVSAHNDLETRMAAYDAGGNDYIVKPYEPVELAHKVAVTRQSIARRHALGGQMQYAQKTAFTAMSSMAEMGVIQDFLRASFACDTPASLAARLIEALQCYGLECQVRFAVNGSWLAFSSRGEATPLEYGMLEHAGRMDRIFQFRDRLSISYPNLTLIVYPLPLDDAELVGRLRDHLAVLAEGAEARLLALENVRRQQAQASGIHAIVVRLSATIDEVGRKQADSRLRAGEIDENFLREQVNAFVNLGLSEDQENRLADLGQRTHQKLAALRDIDATLSDQLRGVVAELRALVAG